MPENTFDYEPLLEINTAHNPSDTELNRLAEFMTKTRDRIPAGYTYLGQFIDHDLALDSVVETPPWHPIPSSVFLNKRTPFLNLETVYGFESPDNPTQPKRELLLADNSKSLLKLGDTKATSITKKVFAGKDLPRIPNSPTALLVDPRNDDNLAVAQTHVAFMRFHNSVVRYLFSLGKADTTETFEEARKIVIQHYQWIILKDYLPRVIKKSVLEDVLTNGNQFYFPNKETPFMPLEFSVAAFRFGHSMILNSYNWNRFFNNDQHPSTATLEKLTEFTGRGGLRGEKQLVSDWAINWNWFYKTPDSPLGPKFNFAKEINTKISKTLAMLRKPKNNSLSFDRANSLPALDLYRARALNLPPGQEIAKRILGTETRILQPEQIANLLPANLKHVFSKETPLWFYLLAEAEIEEQGYTLGEVGSRIIAETFAGLIKAGKTSVFNRNFELNFKPNPAFFPHEKEFGMAQLLKFGKTGNQDFDELNPLG